MSASGRVYCKESFMGSVERLEAELPALAVGLAAGQSDLYNYALLQDGEVWRWQREETWSMQDGEVVLSQNGVGDATRTGLTARAELGTAAISGANDDICAIAENGRVRCVSDAATLPFPTTGVDELDIGGAATQVAISSVHRGCALRNDGAVVCWDSGSDTPTWTVALGEPAVEIGFGDRFGCARLQGGDVKCWGDGAGGVLGRGDLNSVDPVADLASMAPIDLGGRAVSLTTGEHHSCALLEDTSLRCWGRGWGGKLGYDANHYVGDGETPDAFPPLDVGGAIDGLGLSVESSCALLTDGALRCWGTAEQANLVKPLPWGLPTDYPRIELEEPVVAIAGMWSHGGSYGPCVVLASGELRCRTPDGWEEQVFEQPVAKADVYGSARCALLQSGGLRCWGISDEWLQGVGLGDDVVDIGVGRRFFCAIVADGVVRCGGNNYYGQLGYGNTADVYDDAALQEAGDVSLGERAVQIEAGDSFVCARLESDQLSCWGFNSGDEPTTGQLGLGHTNTIGDNEPPAAAGTLDFGGAKVTDFCLGSHHGCALLEGGDVSCWGSNESGQLGYGHSETIGDDETPATAGPVSVGARATDVFCGHQLSCAMLENGDVRCWGNNHAGALGLRSLVDIGDDETPAQAGPVPYE